MGPRDKGALSVAAGALRQLLVQIDDSSSPSDALLRALMAELRELAKSGDEARLREIINFLVDAEKPDR